MCGIYIQWNVIQKGSSDTCYNTDEPWYIMQSEISQTQKNKYYIISHKWTLFKFLKSESRMVNAKGWMEGRMGTGFQFYTMAKVLEMDDGWWWYLHNTVNVLIAWTENGNFWPASPPDLNSAHCACIRACLHICVIFTRDRAIGQPLEYRPRGGLERKHPFSPPLSSWYITGQVSTSHPRPVHWAPPGARVREVLGGQRGERAVQTLEQKAWSAEKGSLEEELGEKSSWQREAVESWCRKD